MVSIVPVHPKLLVGGWVHHYWSSQYEWSRSQVIGWSQVNLEMKESWLFSHSGGPLLFKVEGQLLKRQAWQANVNSGLVRPSPVPAYRLSVGMCMSGCAPTVARTSYKYGTVDWLQLDWILAYSCVCQAVHHLGLLRPISAWYGRLTLACNWLVLFRSACIHLHLFVGNQHFRNVHYF